MEQNDFMDNFTVIKETADTEDVQVKCLMISETLKIILVFNFVISLSYCAGCLYPPTFFASGLTHWGLSSGKRSSFGWFRSSLVFLWYRRTSTPVPVLKTGNPQLKERGAHSGYYYNCTCSDIQRYWPDACCLVSFLRQNFQTKKYILPLKNF